MNPDGEWSAGKKAFSLLVFPLIFGGGLAAVVSMMNSAVEPGTAYLIPAGFAFLALSVLEHAVPYRQAWRKADRVVRVDLGHLIVSGGLTGSERAPN